MKAGKPMVLDAACRLLAINPRASTQEIAAAAGISRMTLHRLFPSREALVEELGQMAMDRIAAAFAAARLEEEPFVEALTRLIDALIPLIHQFAFLVAEFQLKESETLKTGEQALQEQIEQLLQRGRHEGALRDDLPLPWLAYVLGGLLLAADDAVRAGSIAPRETSRLVLESFLGGAAARGDRPSSRHLVTEERTTS